MTDDQVITPGMARAIQADAVRERALIGWVVSAGEDEHRGNRITTIIATERAVTPDTALRLARYFGTTPEFWTNLQANHDLSVEVAKHGAQIADEVRPRAA